MLVGESSQDEDVGEDSDDDLGPNLTNETLASVEALLKVELYKPKFFTKLHSDDESIVEESRISSRMLKSN
jgi:hypothetical protein